MWTAGNSPHWSTFAIRSNKVVTVKQQAAELANKLHANYGKKFHNNILLPLQTRLPLATCIHAVLMICLENKYKINFVTCYFVQIAYKESVYFGV